ncbi:MAG: helix-turn-helix domain-containing protein [Candidatus Nanoarchaeia archaeon]|jgi:DNA-binding transcriptional ArsR family regulator
MKYLLKKDNGFFVKKFKELKPRDLKGLTSDLRLKILRELRENPTYPNQLAKKLKLHEQKIYYHINELKKAGIISVVKTEEIKGSVANYYGVKADAFGIELTGNYERIKLKDRTPESISKFFKEFKKEGKFNGLIIVGSPLPHGSFKAVARDGHYAAQLGLFLGNFINIGKSFNVYLDTDAINEKKLDENLILIGGPGTNLVTAQINEYLPINFNENNYWTSIKTKNNEYNDDTCAIIAKIKNPFNKDKVIIIIAGLRVVGTKAGVIAITNNYDELLKGYDNGDLIKVIKGFDFDGDGKVDGVEILE